MRGTEDAVPRSSRRGSGVSEEYRLHPPQPNPSQRLLTSKQTAHGASEILFTELVCALKSQAREASVLSLPRIRPALVELVKCAAREAEDLAEVESTAAFSAKQAEREYKRHARSRRRRR